MREIVLVIFASTALHLAAFYVEESSIDLMTWALAARGILEDGDFYRSTFPGNCFCYPPLWAWLLAPIGALIDPVGQYQYFAFASRLPIMIGNLAVGFLLLKKFRADRGIFSLWMLNPIAIGVAQAGDFDVLPALLSLLAIWFAERREPIPSALSLGLGIALKIYPIMFLPIILLDFSKR
ncbi:MAG: glycosyltransferase 87 family protein, partial [Candidatus Bathyarchaeia archaeon]